MLVCHCFDRIKLRVSRTYEHNSNLHLKLYNVIDPNFLIPEPLSLGMLAPYNNLNFMYNGVIYVWYNFSHVFHLKPT